MAMLIAGRPEQVEAGVVEALADLREDPPEAIKTVTLPVYSYARARAKAEERQATETHAKKRRAS